MGFMVMIPCLLGEKCNSLYAICFFHVPMVCHADPVLYFQYFMPKIFRPKTRLMTITLEFAWYRPGLGIPV